MRYLAGCVAAVIATVGTLGKMTHAQTEPWLFAGEPLRLPEVVVTEKAFHEESPIGPYNQPAWTTSQYRSPNVPVYVLPPWKVEFNQWWKGEWPKKGKAEHEFQEEIEVGLPHRFQLDFYEVWERTDEGTVRHKGNKVELRHALADWGKIPLNPTLYAEWKFNEQEADAYELKLLLGEELAPRWHWGFNAIYEQQVGDARETELSFSQALTYSLIDEKLTAGIEMKFEHATEEGSRGDPEIEFLIGPTIQWSPIRRTRLSVAPLFGVTGDSPRVEAFAVFAIEFGRGYEAEGGVAPHSIGQ
jgi:hypothetical protein